MKKFLAVTLVLIILLAVLALALRMKGSSLLKLYIESGIGTCANIPILCMTPQGEVLYFKADKEFDDELIPHSYPRMKISIPRGFDITQEAIKQKYYKKRKFKGDEPAIYVMHQEQGFFLNLFPDSKKWGVADDYEFVKRTMFARIDAIKSIQDAFFVVMKSIFIPDVGDQRKVAMREFKVADKRGFVNYSLAETGNFFDCNVINSTGGYFKVYIKDTGAKLDLDKVMTVVSTIIEPDKQ